LPSLYTNRRRNESGGSIYDGGALIASGGKMLAMGPRFSLDSHIITSAIVDIEATRMGQARTSSFMPALGDDAKVVRAPFDFPAIAPEAGGVKQAAWETGPRI